MSDPDAGHDVFISYASGDRRLVLEVVDGLEALGLRAWVDRRQIDGFYGTEIAAAIANAGAVVFFASAESFRSNNTLTELSLANRKRRPIVPVYLEDVAPPLRFEYLLELPQRVDLWNLPEPRRLEEICRKLKAWGVAAAPGRGRAAISAQAQRVLGIEYAGALGEHPLASYLADRRAQEHELADALALHHDEYVRRPIVLIAFGRHEQAVNHYVDRLHQYTLPRALRGLKTNGYQQVVKRIDRQWPPEGWESDPARTLARLKRDLLEQFELPPTGWPAHLAESLARFEAVTMICYHLHRREWGESHLRTLRSWLLEWAQLPDLPHGSPLVIVLAVQEFSGERKARFPRLRPPAPLSTQLKKLAEPKRRELLVFALSELGNVYAADVEHWIREVLRPRDPSAAIARFYEVLDDPALFAADGLPMSRFAKTVKELSFG